MVTQTQGRLRTTLSHQVAVPTPPPSAPQGAQGPSGNLVTENSHPRSSVSAATSVRPAPRGVGNPSSLAVPDWSARGSEPAQPPSAPPTWWLRTLRHVSPRVDRGERRAGAAVTPARSGRGGQRARTCAGQGRGGAGRRLHPGPLQSQLQAQAAGDHQLPEVLGPRSLCCPPQAGGYGPPPHRGPRLALCGRAWNGGHTERTQRGPPDGLQPRTQPHVHPGTRLNHHDSPAPRTGEASVDPWQLGLPHHLPALALGRPQVLLQTGPATSAGDRDRAGRPLWGVKRRVEDPASVTVR